MYRDLAALVHQVRPGIHVPDRSSVEQHHGALDRAMQRGNVVPFPPGLVFRDRKSVRRLLAAQYGPLDEALTLLGGRWAFRVHVRSLPSAPGPLDPADAAGAELDFNVVVHGELRRVARAATPLAMQTGAHSSAAYLVDRPVSDRFLARVHGLERQIPGYTLDVTGPWPPYDFVRILPAADHATGLETT